MIVYTDGSTSPKNPGEGGCAFVALGNSSIFVSSTYLGKDVTNNRAEAEAVKEALIFAKSVPVTNLHIHTDSEYVTFGLTKIIHSKLRTTLGTNVDTWLNILDLLEETKINIKWTLVESHSNNQHNDVADSLAYLATKNRVELCYVMKENWDEYRKAVKKEKETARRASKG